jgi:uridylate kinase|tara:strand:- start:2791 stop:3516 length:726 start_codon:yes stop_codon:yes gene_type:complete
MTDLKYKRLLVKLSGEALMGQYDFGIDPSVIAQLSRELEGLQQAGVELGVVVGGGNLFRGAQLAEAGVDRVTGDHMGMLATVMNALALRDGLQKRGLKATVMSGLDMPQVCDRYTQREARQRIADGGIVIFAAGTGCPYFTTDTGASLRAVEIQADLMVKATKVDGIYNKDPVRFQDAVKYDHIDYDQAIDQRLGVMDVAAMILCNDNTLDMVVCDMSESGVLLELAKGKSIGTLVTRKEA